MNLKTPQFWYKKKSIISLILLPIAFLYQQIHGLLQRTKSPTSVSVPVICVGNAVAGGSGKTPTVIALTSIIKKHALAQNPYILSRGYGRNTGAVTLVTDNTGEVDITGDEAPLLAAAAPVVLSSNRLDGARYAIDQGADLLIMDDGFFNKDLYQDIKMLVVDRQMDFGNGRTLPAGPLREPLSKILPRTNCVMTIGQKFAANLPVFETEIKPLVQSDPNKTYIGFAGIGFPDKFKNTLIDENYNLVGWHAFPDHYTYSQNDLDQLIAEANDKDAVLITTEKDHARIPNDLKNKVQTLPISLIIKDEDTLLSFLKERLS